MNDRSLMMKFLGSKSTPFFAMFLLLFWAVSSLTARQVSQLGKLSWKNGDMIPGHVIRADRSQLAWMGESLFRDPLSLDLRYLNQIEFPVPADAVKTTATYAVQTIDGLSLFGEVKSLNREILVISSERFGDIEIARDRIGSILNLKTSGSLINGEFDLTRWDSSRGQKKYWTVDDQGDLQSTRADIHLFMKTEIPASALIELELKWNKKLDFIFGFGVPRNARNTDSIPRLETWDDSLVLSYGEDFEIVVESFSNQEKRIKLLIHWDQEQNQIIIHDEQGQRLSSAKLPTPGSQSEPGLFIENKSGDLTVANLMVRQSSAGFNATLPSFQKLNQAAANGELIEFDGTRWVARASEPSNEVNPGDCTPDEPVTAATDMVIPADQFCNAFLINPAINRPTDQTRVYFQDGMFVLGELVSIENETITLNTKFSSQPVSLSLAGAAKIQLHSSAPPTVEAETFSHQLFNSSGTIRGRVEPGSGEKDDVLRWRVAGAESAVPFSQADARIVLQARKPIVDAAEEWADTLYLANRDTIPCRVVSIDERQVTIDSFAENKQIDSQLIKAIDFRNAITNEIVLPTDKEWQIPTALTKQAKIQDDKFRLSKNAKIRHPWLMSSGGFEFQLNWNAGSYGALELQLFSNDLANSDVGKKLQVMMYGGNVYVAESAEGIAGDRMLEVKNDTAKFQVKYERGQITVLVDGKTAYSDKLKPEQVAGRGVTFKLTDQFQQNIRASLSNFRIIVSESGGGALVDPVRKELLLMIPRLKQAHPPAQILCAANMDMLRGELVGLDENFVQFRANNELKQFPRSIVSSLVWLHPELLPKAPAVDGESTVATTDSTTGETPATPETASPETAASSDSSESAASSSTNASVEQTNHQTVQVLMHGNRRMTSTLKSWSESHLVGDSTALGECQIPFEQIYELRFGFYATKAVDVPFADWVVKLAPAPKLETGADGEVGSELIFGSSSPLIGTTPQAVTLMMLDETKISLEEMRGKIIVLDFWATWCAPCVKAIPDLTSAVDQFTEDEVLFVAVNQLEDVATIKAFLESRDLDFPIARDDGKLGKKFQVESLPQTVIIDQTGKIAFLKIGSSADLKEKLIAAIEHLIATGAAE